MYGLDWSWRINRKCHPTDSFSCSGETCLLTTGQNAFFESANIVTGPLLTSSTSIIS